MHIVSPRRNRRTISITSLIDVVFILLIFFMLATNFSIDSSIELHSSTGQGEWVESVQEPVLLELSKQGEHILHGQIMELNEIVERIDALVSEHPNIGVIIQPYQDLPIQNVITVLDELSGVGVRNVSLQR